MLFHNIIKPLGGNADVSIGLMVDFMGEQNFTEVRMGEYDEDLYINKIQ